MDLGDLFQRLGIALAIGLIVGLQRERTGSVLAGFRTFPLVTIFGCLCGLLAFQFDVWIIAAGLVALAAIIVMGNLEHRPENPGLTTEMSMLAMFLLGAYLIQGPVAVAIAVGGTIAVLLHLKPQMHALARGLADPDFKAIMQFVLITLVILPVLPNRTYGPFNVLNPFKIWLMVVLIVGISLGAYIIYKFFGSRVGTFAGGILGGLISSTATTVSYARGSAQSPGSSRIAAFAIMAASTVVFIRVLLIISATAPDFLPAATGPILAMLAGLVVLTIILWRLIPKEDSTTAPHQANPSELKAALIFAGLYGLVLLAVAAAREYFGSSGLYLVAVVSGLTDMDAITLSVSQMANKSEIAPGTGWRLIITAALANLLFKGATVAFLGSRELFRRILIVFSISFALGATLIFLWPTP
jgi:uncharacterized membrane protein (DUF4010 family)